MSPRSYSLSMWAFKRPRRKGLGLGLGLRGDEELRVKGSGFKGLELWGLWCRWPATPRLLAIADGNPQILLLVS